MTTEKQRAAKRAYHQAHRAEIIARVAAWVKQNPDKVRANKRNYNERHRAEVNAQTAAYKREHPEKVREYNESHREENRKRRRDYYERHRAELLQKNGEYAKAHREQQNKANLKYYENNRVKVLAAAAARIAKNPEKERERHRVKGALWVKNHPEESRARCKEYYDQHREEMCERHRKWMAEHPEFNRQYAQNRRARKAAAPGRHTRADVAAMFIQQGEMCKSCATRITKTGERSYHLDHIMPLCRGGSDGPENLQLLCARCNLSKARKHPKDWYMKPAS